VAKTVEDGFRTQEPLTLLFWDMVFFGRFACCG
jgi:hypothetical protein